MLVSLHRSPPSLSIPDSPSLVDLVSHLDPLTLTSWARGHWEGSASGSSGVGGPAIVTGCEHETHFMGQDTRLNRRVPVYKATRVPVYCTSGFATAPRTPTIMRVLLFVLAFGLAYALDLDAEWVTFKKSYNKQYKDVEEESFRRKVYEFHLDLIQKHNLEADRGVHTYFLGVNEYADMPNKEFVGKLNGYKQREQRVEGGATFLPPSNVGDLPDTVDWRPKGYVTPIKNQGQCGSCWSFSATGSLEGQTFKKTGKLVSLSEQNLVDCSKKQGNMGCEGGLMDQAFTYIKTNKGIDTETSYPYLARDSTCKFNPVNVGANDTGFVDVKTRSETDLQSAVATVGPIAVAIDASHTTFQLYSHGVYHNFLCSQSRLDHGVLAVGYGQLESKDYWLVKNSWGTTWGQDGYIMMSRNRDNNCGIATQASYPTV